jgi:hypothetical protein
MQTKRVTIMQSITNVACEEAKIKRKEDLKAGGQHGNGTSVYHTAGKEGNTAHRSSKEQHHTPLPVRF